MKEVVFLNSNDIDLMNDFVNKNSGNYYSTSGLKNLFKLGINQVMEMFFQGFFIAFGIIEKNQLIDLIIINNSDAQVENRKFILLDLFTYNEEFLDEVFDELKDLLELKQLRKYKIGLTETSQLNLEMLKKIGFKSEFSICSKDGKKYTELGKLYDEKICH